jgi:hypothetical protein
MYQINNRSVHEHELYSFNISRESLKWSYRANLDHLQELEKADNVELMTHYAQLKGLVYRRKALSPKRLRGITAFAATYGIYAYLPYMAVFTGSTVPIFAACMAALYGVNSFSETNYINSIRVVDNGKLEINVALSPFASKNITTDIKSVKSVVSIGHDDMGEEDQEGNLIRVDSYVDGATGTASTEAIHLALQGDAFRDKQFLDWILSDKSREGTLADDF